MKKRKSKALTVLFSLFPGAGHMYLGLMKMGLSLMSLLFFIVFLSSWLTLGPLLYILPVVWAYSFFDCLNKLSADGELLDSYEDHYLFSFDRIVHTFDATPGKLRLWAGILLLIFGCYLIWTFTLPYAWGMIPPIAYNALSSLTRLAPQLLFSILIIAAGVKLILGRKSQEDHHDA